MDMVEPMAKKAQKKSKQIFADYKVHLVTTSDTHSNTKLGTGTLTNQREEDTTTEE